MVCHLDLSISKQQPHHMSLSRAVLPTRMVGQKIMYEWEAHGLIKYLDYFDYYIHTQHWNLEVLNISFAALSYASAI